MFWVLIIVLLIVAGAAAPGVALEHPYGFAPSGLLLTLVVVVLVVLVVTGRL
jgi:uncharacterized protein DUF3309